MDDVILEAVKIFGVLHDGVKPPETTTVKSTTEPQLKLAQGSKGFVPHSCCMTRILVVSFKAPAGTVNGNADSVVGGVPFQVPIDSQGSNNWF